MGCFGVWPKFWPPAACFPIGNRYLEVPKCQNFPPAAGFMLIASGNLMRRRGCLILEGRSPPQAENFAISEPLNADFQWENEPPEAKIWSKSNPKRKEPPPSLRTKSTRRGGLFKRITPDTGGRKPGWADDFSFVIRESW